MKRFWILVHVSWSALALAACTDDDDFYDEYYDVPVTTAYWEDWSSSAMYGMSDPFGDPYYPFDTLLRATGEPLDDPEAAAEIVAESIEGYFGDCATAERVGSMLAVTLSECSGPFSAQSIDGVLRASFRTGGDGSVPFDVSSTDLTVDGASASLTAAATYREDGDQKTVEYTSQRTFTRNGRRFEGDFDSTLTWAAGSNCVTRNATAQVVTAGRTFDVQIDEYTRCGRQCPSSGRVTVTRRDDDAAVMLMFDGTDRARLTRDGDGAETVRIECDL